MRGGVGVGLNRCQRPIFPKIFRGRCPKADLLEGSTPRHQLQPSRGTSNPPRKNPTTQKCPFLPTEGTIFQNCWPAAGYASELHCHWNFVKPPGLAPTPLLKMCRSALSAAPGPHRGLCPWIPADAALCTTKWRIFHFGYRGIEPFWKVSLSEKRTLRTIREIIRWWINQKMKMTRKR